MDIIQVVIIFTYKFIRIIFISARFDLTVLAPYLLPELKIRYGSIRVLKKDNAYFSVTCDLFNFKDAMFFSAPGSLSKYLKQNGVSELKSVFPYSAYNSIEEIKNQVEFPAHSKFFSELKKTNISITDYNNAKEKYDRCKSLPNEHDEKMHNLSDWLKYYNLMDVVPLATAIDNSFKNF